ncbi:MAG: hypothetical protein LBU48_00340 [Coriobacteriales bacterium]|jgi:hypothetical protein|nr:hypothetical protein [Coriobacteriales bacterium]
MAAQSENESKSYRDPLGARIQAVSAAHERRAAKYPPVKEVYEGFYLQFNPNTQAGTHFLAGSEGIIGTKMGITAEADKLLLTTFDGRALAQLEGKPAEKIRRHLLNGWSVNVMLSLIIYTHEGNSFTGELACICFDPALGLPLESFVKNITYRISKGTHPGLKLMQEQLIKVLESNGAWYLTKDVPLPERKKGSIIYKRRKTWSEHLTSAAIQGNIGCKIVSTMAWIAIAAGILLAIWWFLLR